jgi:hypothetical protein
MWCDRDALRRLRSLEIDSLSRDCLDR